IASRVVTFPSRWKASVTAGLKCPPLRRPRREYTTTAPADAKIEPVISRRSAALATCLGIGDAAPKSRVAADSPTKRMSAVPKNSARYAFGCQPRHGSRCGGAIVIGEVMLTSGQSLVWTGAARPLGAGGGDAERRRSPR